MEYSSALNNAAYQYIVMPSTNKEEAETAWQNPTITIVSNTPEIQAVWHNKLNIMQAVFYESGNLRIPGGYHLIMENPG